LRDLQSDLSKDETAQLHRRASRWYAQANAGEPDSFVGEAIQHALSAKDYATAVALLERHAMGMIMQGYVKTVNGWMAIQHGRVAENPVAEMMSTSSLVLMVYEHGQLHLAYEIAAPVCARLEQAGLLPPTGAGLYGLLGEGHYKWGHFEQARSHILRAVQLCTLGSYNTVAAWYQVILSRLFKMEGDLEAATSEIQVGRSVSATQSASRPGSRSRGWPR
jgi:ATP/maltotriose-dependent transcriptional regulator MalT